MKCPYCNLDVLEGRLDLHIRAQHRIGVSPHAYKPEGSVQLLWKKVCYRCYGKGRIRIKKDFPYPKVEEIVCPWCNGSGYGYGVPKESWEK